MLNPKEVVCYLAGNRFVDPMDYSWRRCRERRCGRGAHEKRENVKARRMQIDGDKTIGNVSSEKSLIYGTRISTAY